MAGLQSLYEFDDTGALVKVEAHVLDTKSDLFTIEAVPLVA